MLRAWTSGDRAALHRVVTVLYPELRRIAQRYMRRERPGHTLQTTALVNEAYMRLIDIRQVEWHDRAHFFAVSAELMRRVLVDHARSHGYVKRGGGAARVSLEECAPIHESRLEDLLDLDQALIALAKVDNRKARVVELRFFGGLSADEIATVLGVSSETVTRDWKLSKVWLTRHMNRPKEPV
jgi:RNA polymerase sigma factor (TIGR02999 family)